MPPARKRPPRYLVRVVTPAWTAELLIEHGFCTAADGHLGLWVGKSAAWIFGRMIHEGWHGTMLPAPDPVRQGALL
jgi:hypothetical protein